MTDQRDLFQSLSLKRRNLHEQIAEAMQEMVAENRLPRGSQLPPERELAQLLGVNRTTLREAIHLLEQRGLVEMKAGSGTFVRETIAAHVVADCIERQVAFGNCSHDDLVTLREIIEPGVAALAAKYATPEDLARLQSSAGEIEESFAAGDFRRSSEADVAFHVDLAAATHNELIAAIAAGLQKAMLTWMLAQSVIHIEEGAVSHRRVYEAVSARDPVRARRAMDFHMTTTRRSQLGLAASRQPEPGEYNTVNEGAMTPR